MILVCLHNFVCVCVCVCVCVACNKDLIKTTFAEENFSFHLGVFLSSYSKLSQIAKAQKT